MISFSWFHTLRSLYSYLHEGKLDGGVTFGGICMVLLEERMHISRKGIGDILVLWRPRPAKHTRPRLLRRGNILQLEFNTQDKQHKWRERQRKKTKQYLPHYWLPLRCYKRCCKTIINNSKKNKRSNIHNLDSTCVGSLFRPPTQHTLLKLMSPFLLLM